VFENRVLRRIFRPKRKEVEGGWTRLHNKEVYNPYASPNIIMAIKLGRMGWAGHIARMGELRNALKYTKFWSKNLNGRGRSGDLGIDGKLTLEWIFGETKWEVVNCIHVAKDRDQWWALVNMVINLRVA
jgi:hypothetical protein